MSGLLNSLRPLFAYNAGTDLRWLDAVSDTLVSLAYFSIAFTLLRFTRKRRGLAINGLLGVFGTLIVARGMTLLMTVWGLWRSPSPAEAVLDAITAILAVTCAIACIRLLPEATRLATLAETVRLNATLRAEVESRSQAESRLQNLLEARRTGEEAKLNAFLEAVAEGMLVVSQDGKIDTANSRIQKMFGYSREELVGQSMDILVPARYRAVHAGHRNGYFADPGVRAMGAGRDLTGCRKDGTEFSVEIGLSYVQTESGTLALGLVSDITERKRVESEIARINGELVRSNSELGQFAYVASHDLQEPLRMISGYLQLLERRYKDKIDAEAVEFIHYAVEGALRMKRLIEDLLSLSRTGTQAANFRPVESRTLFENACKNLSVAIEESGAEVTADPLPLIVADPGLLAQVFQNLIGNAIKFRMKEHHPRIHVTAAKSGSESGKDDWVFSVSDDGIGIEPRHLERIFGIFERLHSTDQYEGSGVGLAIARRILERHGGRIWVESKPGEGSTFSFLIPSQTDRLSSKTAVSGKS